MNTSALLTKRESEIAELFAWGASKKDIANRLYISQRTVENHTRNIYEKIGCSKVNELSAWWFCTTFHISFSLSPLKRKVIALSLLAVILPKVFDTSNIVFRPSRMRARTTIVCRARHNEFDN